MTHRNDVSPATSLLPLRGIFRRLIPALGCLGLVACGGGASRAVPAVAAVEISVTGLQFGEQQVGTASAPQAVKVQNSGAVLLEISKISLSGGDPASFNLSNACGANLAPAADCNVSLTFAPGSSGAKTAQLDIVTSAGSNRSVTLSGTGSLPPPPPPSIAGIIPYGSSDPAVLLQASLTSAATVEAIGGGRVIGSPDFDAVKGMRPGVDGGAFFQGIYLNTRSAGQLSIEVEKQFIAQPSPDAISGGIGGSEGYSHLADGWLQFIDARGADDASVAALGLTDLAAVGGGLYQSSFTGKGVHSAGKGDFVRVTLSWTGNTCELYIDGLLHNSIAIPPTGSAARVDIGKIAVGYSPPGSFRVQKFYFRNLVLASRAVGFTVHPQLSKVIVYGDSFASQTNPSLIGSTHFDATVGFQLMRDMNARGMSIGELVLKDYPGQVLNKSPSAGQVSFQLGINRFNGADDKLTDVVNGNADYVVIMGGTNDATGDAAARGSVAPGFAADLLSMCRAILNNARTKGVIVQTLMSTKGNADYATPAFVANVAAINASINALSGAWDSAYPSEKGKVKVVDTFTATGGENAAPRMIKGTLTGALDDLHPAAFASVISADLLADALQAFVSAGVL